MRIIFLSIVFAVSAAAACGGKVVFDGIPGAGGSGGSATHVSSTASVQDGPVSSTVQVGSSVVTTSTGPMNCGSVTFGGAGCDQCAHDNCCPELAGCDTGTDCNQVLMCVQSCGPDQSCQQKCAATFPNGVGPFNQLAMCISTNCQNECNGPGANGICDSGLTTQSTTCDSCMSQFCCKEADTCTGGMNGMNSQQVMKCIADCTAMPPGPLCAPLLDCMSTTCMSQCM